MFLFIILALGAFASADKLDRTYLPPPGSKFAGGSPDAILPPIEVPRDSTVSASTVRPIQPGFQDTQRPSYEGDVQSVPNRQYSQKPGVFTPGVTSYSEVTRKPGFSSSQSSATSVTPYHPYSVPTTTTSYAFTQTTTFSPIDDECVGATCAYEQDSFVDSGIEPQISISHQTPDQYSQVNQASQKPGFSTQTPIRTQTQSVSSSKRLENVPAQRFDNEGRPITYDPSFSTESSIRQQGQVSERTQGSPDFVAPGQSTFSTVRPTIPSYLGTQAPTPSFDQQGRPVSQVPYQPSQYFDNNRLSQSFDREGYKVPNAPDQYRGTIPQRTTVAPGQSLGYEHQRRPIHPNYSQSTTSSQFIDNITHRPIQSFDQRGQPVSNIPSSSSQFYRPSSEQVTSQDIGDSAGILKEKNNVHGRPISGQSSKSQRPVQRIDEQGRPILLPSGVSSQYPGYVSSASVDQQSGPIIPSIDNNIQVDQQGRPISVSDYPSEIVSSSTPFPITSLSPNTITEYGTNRLPGAIDSTNIELGQQYQGINTNRHERPQADSDRSAVILDYKNIITPEGEFAYSYDTSNGIHADENGTAIDGVKAQGSYSYIGDDGKFYSIEYTADENGYQPRGDHLPTPPPIPEEILRVIEKVNQEKAAGIVNDGFYDEGKYGHKKYQGTMNLLPTYADDDNNTFDSGKILNSLDDETEDQQITSERLQPNVPYRGYPSNGQVQQPKSTKLGRPQKTGGHTSQSIPSNTDDNFSEADILSDYDEQNFSANEKKKPIDSVPYSQRPSDHLQNKNRVASRRPVGSIKPTTRQPITNKYYNEEYTDEEDKTEISQSPKDRNINIQRIDTDNKGFQRGHDNKLEEQDHRKIPYDSSIPQNRQRLSSKSPGKPGQQISSGNDDQQHIDVNEESVSTDDQSGRVNDIKYRHPSSVPGMMRHKVTKSKPVLDNRNENPEQEELLTEEEDDKTIQRRPYMKDSNRTPVEPTRASSRNRIQRPGLVNRHPTTKYPGTHVSKSEEYSDTEIDSSEGEFDSPTVLDRDERKRPYSSTTRRPTVSVQPSRGSVTKGSDNTVQASTAKPSVIIQGEDKISGYQYIPPKTIFVQDNRQEAIPVSQKPSFTTTRPITAPIYSDSTQLVDTDETFLEDNDQLLPGVQDHTTTPLGYFDSGRNVSIPLKQGKQPLNRPYGHKTSIAPLTPTGSTSGKSDFNRFTQRPQGTINENRRQGTYSTATIPTSTTRYPSTIASITQNQFGTSVQSYPESELNEDISGTNRAEQVPADYNNNVPSQSDIKIPSGRPSRPGYFPTTAKPYDGQSGPTTAYPNKPVYSGTQSTYPEFSPSNRDDYTGAKFVSSGVTESPKTFNRYTPSGVSEIVPTPSSVTSVYDDRRGFPTGRPESSFAGQMYSTNTPQIGQIGGDYPQGASGVSEFPSTPGRLISSSDDRRGSPQTERPATKQVPQRPMVDKYGRPISTQDRVKGEDFRGPKQPARFDPETGYHY